MHQIILKNFTINIMQARTISYQISHQIGIKEKIITKINLFSQEKTVKSDKLENLATLQAQTTLLSLNSTPMQR